MKKLIVFLGITILCSCENSESEINALNKRVIQKDVGVKIESFLSQEGQVKARLTAPTMVRVAADTPYIEFPKSLHVDFYNADKSVNSYLDSRYGRYFESLAKIYLKDSIKVIRLNGDTLFCKDLWWDQNKQLFYTDLPVLLKAPDKYIPGENGLEATQNFDRITFNNVNKGKIVTADETVPRK